MAYQIPVIDISPYFAGDTQQTRRIASEIDKAGRSSGFFQLTGHGVAHSIIDNMLSKSSEFFDLPDAKKREILGPMRGYQAPELAENISSSRKEGFCMADDLPDKNRLLLGGNKWLDESDAPGFKQAVEEYYVAVNGVALVVLRLIALALELEENFFDNLATQEEGVKLCRAVRYPPGSVEDQEVAFGAHADDDAITLVYQDNVGGLQVLDGATQQWQDVKPVYGAFVVNIGRLFERWTNDTYVAAQHRVLYSRHQRHSITFFLSGWLDQVIECLPPFLKPGEEAKYKPQTVEENTLEWLSRGYGHNSKVEVQG